MVPRGTIFYVYNIELNLNWIIFVFFVLMCFGLLYFVFKLLCPQTEMVGSMWQESLLILEER